jgi:hypothetical protein
MVMRFFYAKVGVLAAFAVNAACAGDLQRSDVMRWDSAGVEIVVASAHDRALAWTFERQLSLGGEEEGAESFYWVTNSSVGTDAAGRIFVLNPSEHQVVKFTSEGEYIGSVARRGGGPGEIQAPGSLAVAPDGSVSVFDFGKRSLVRFDPEGELLPEVPFRFSPWPGPARHMAHTDAGLVVAAMIPPTEENTFRHALQLLASEDTIILGERSFPRPGMVRYPSCGGGLNLPKIFEVQITWAASGEAVVLSRSADYEIEVLRGGTLLRKVRRDMASRVATEALAVAELGEGFRINFGSGPCTIPVQEMVAGRGYAEVVPWVDQITVAPDGEVWVRRKEIGHEAVGPIDVFDPTGAYTGTLPSGAPFPLFFMDTRRFGARETDEFDVSRLVIYDIQRK